MRARSSADGRGPVNPKGLQYYNNLIDELIRYGIEPHVTLFHSDNPQALEDEYGGWRSKKIVKDFTAFADVCFREFGDRVTYWTTINEANVFALGFDQTTASPYAYPVAHNCLLAHASAARLYKRKYQGEQQGFIGLNLYSYWYVPLTNATEDVLATKRALDFAVGWIMDPLTFGDYPESMKKNAGSRLPSFTLHESHQVMNSYDFIGLNHYSTMYVKDNPDSLKVHPRNVFKDMAAKVISKDDGVPAGEYPIDPGSMQGMLEYFKQNYGNPPIYVHENGQRTPSNTSLNDISRVKYLHGYIGSLLEALRNGSNARGYFTWSFLDVFELLYGYESRFGLYYVDFNDPDLKRYAKLSAHWYSNFLKGRNLTDDGIIDADQKSIYTLPQTTSQ
ncbi:Beta-glucosidase [Thalictrum thalictroides]|uniref:Beta-glucosidase n=1 Tax=Thalictrum thalictroides TaxID=46969 RepID=A0A7J6V4J2_THATH|nr:Beta-glucosidase [Thalictrum thalictroides]